MEGRYVALSLEKKTLPKEKALENYFFFLSFTQKNEQCKKGDLDDYSARI